MYTLPFQEITNKSINLAGGKGASLGEMTYAKIPVPHGFVLISKAFEEFLKETDVNVEIDAALGKVDAKDTESVEEASEVIRALILKAKMPEKIKSEIIREFKKLKSSYVAVRSSATAEDSKVDSWAGELETYLNTTQKTLLQNVQKCWASLFTPRAIFYRFERKLHKQKVSVAVVVQKMIQSEVAGVCFTVHPITKDKNQMVIEACWGLGELLVSGQCTPDTYVVDKKDNTILDINISEQDKMIIKSKNKNKTLKVSKSKSEKQKLDNKTIIELADICKKIEKHYQSPQDIEWALEKGRIYITQARPITTL